MTLVQLANVFHSIITRIRCFISYKKEIMIIEFRKRNIYEDYTELVLTKKLRINKNYHIKYIITEIRKKFIEVDEYVFIIIYYDRKRCTLFLIGKHEF